MRPRSLPSPGESWYLVSLLFCSSIPPPFHRGGGGVSTEAGVAGHPRFRGGIPVLRPQKNSKQIQVETSLFPEQLVGSSFLAVDVEDFFQKGLFPK